MVKKILFITSLIISTSLNAKIWKHDINEVLEKEKINIKNLNKIVEEIEPYTINKFKSAEEASEVNYRLERLIIITNYLLNSNINVDKKELENIKFKLNNYSEKLRKHEK